MRRAKWSRANEAGFGRQQAADRMNPCGLETLLKTHRRQDARNAFRQHGFSRSWRTDHKQVVASSHCHFNRTLRVVLATNIAEIFGAPLSVRVEFLTFEAKGIN